MFRSCLGGGAKTRGGFEDVTLANVKGNGDFDDAAVALPAPDSGSQDDDDKSTNVAILLEIVGAVGLQSSTADSFVTVRQGRGRQEREVHRTKTIPKDPAPIWTVKTKSLCIIQFHERQPLTIQLCCHKNLVPVPGTNVIPLYNIVGSVTLDFNTLVKGQGERVEMTLSSEGNIRLALRYRKATEEDLAFYKGKRRSGGVEAAAPKRSSSRPTLKDSAYDVEFTNVSRLSLLQQQRKSIKVNGKKEMMYRVYPFPDPDRKREETEFMTQKQMDEFMYQPSREWVEVGWGDYGSVFLEVLGADELPNMDVDVIDGLTDAFVACVFEDTFVRTPVIHDNLNPRFPPWSQRAFKFNIAHPSSLMYLGVLDYDELTLDDHDPIGRLVLHLDAFEPNTVYVLKYPLYNGDTEEEQHQGTLTIRLRISWDKSYSEVSKARSYKSPPRFIINTKSKRSWYVIRYLTRGAIDMTGVTMDSVRVYANELVEHCKEYCYLFDVAAGVVLWRGSFHTTVFGRNLSIWFPMDSLFLLGTAVVGLEFPMLLPSVFLYVIAYMLLRRNYFLSTNPSPWRSVRSFRHIAFANLGAAPHCVCIEQKSGEEESEIVRRVEEYRMHRTTSFIYESLMIMLQVYRIYSKTTPVDISTVAKSGGLVSRFYVNYLAYLHMLLKYLCNCIRILKSFAGWHSNTTYRFTVQCLLAATAWAFFPYKNQSIWFLRAAVWLFLGPWVKLLDVFWIRKYYRTRDELFRDGVPATTEEMNQDIASRPNILEPMLTASFVGQLAESGRVVVEDTLKLRDFRELLFGNYSEAIPSVDTTRFPSVPLSTSFAQPYGPVCGQKEGAYKDLPSESLSWTYIPGQKLSGEMIPKERVQSDAITCTTK